ncbi:MAG: hypothetical protein CBHOC_5372 [uncultured Caballeronia sp.]|nr:MAG: hypothetical protein CBHOC_5372 [uncultured Caballeronia sp.]
MRCRQGAQTVAEYETQFTKLARYAPELVATEQRRIRKFIHGLNVELQEGLATTRIDTFGEAIEMAQRLESAKALVKNFQAKRKGVPSDGLESGEGSTPPPKVGRSTGSEGDFGPPRGARSQGSLAQGSQLSEPPSERGSSGSVSQGRQPVVRCGYCGKAGHTVEICWKKSKKCLKCGSAEHRVATCPRRKEIEGVSGSGEQPKGSARVYTLGQQALDSAGEVKGILLVH